MKNVLPAVMSPAGLRSDSDRDLDTPAMARKTVDEYYVPCSNVICREAG